MIALILTLIWGGGILLAAWEGTKGTKGGRRAR